jgi:type III secretory pathway lipoprotein EscJ
MKKFPHSSSTKVPFLFISEFLKDMDTVQSARVTVAFDLSANSTSGENLVVTNLHSSNFA